MTQIAETSLLFLAGWSIRWGVLALLLMCWFTFKPPRSAAVRHTLCLSAMIAGFLLPIAPRLYLNIPLRTGNLTENVAHPQFAVTQRMKSTNTDDGTSPTLFQASLQNDRLASARPVDLTVSKEQPKRASASYQLGPILRTSLFLAWLMIAMCFLMRLVLGMAAIHRLTSETVQVGQESLELLSRCMADLKLSRSASLAIHTEIQAPVVLGGRNPMVLVPPDWKNLPQADRRACLLHELCHLARFDDCIKLAEESARALVFFHPMAWWLFFRLDRERELICDEEVIAQGIDPVRYARLLFDYSRQVPRLGAQARVPGLPFLSSRTVVSRINRLMEEGMSKGIVQPSIRKRCALALASLALALGLTGLHVGVVAQPPATAPKQPEALVVTAKSTSAPKSLQGLVKDANGRPVSRASVLVAVKEEGAGRQKSTQGFSRQLLETDREGIFSAPLPALPFTIEILCQKDSLAPAHQRRYVSDEKDLKNLEFVLQKPSPFVMTLVDRNDRPIVGAEVSIESLCTIPVEKADGNGFGGTVTICYDTMEGEAIRGTPFEIPYTTRSDSAGNVRFDRLGTVGGIRFKAQVPGLGSMRVDPSSLHGNKLIVAQGFVPQSDGLPPRVKLIRGAKLTGRVTTRLPGISTAVMAVFIQGSRSDRSGPEKNIYAKTATDADGRFSFEGLDEGTVNVLLGGHSADGPWTYHAAKDVRLESGKTSEASIELIEGVRVEGRVISAVDGRGLRRAQVASYGAMRPRTGAATLSVETDESGVYHYRVPEGETYFYLMGEPAGFVRPSFEECSITVSVVKRGTKFVVPPIKVVPARELHGQIIDARGRIIADASVSAIQRERNHTPVLLQNVVSDRAGRFRIQGEGLLFPAGKKVRLHVVPKGGTRIFVEATPAMDGSMLVRLPVSNLLEMDVIPEGIEGPKDVKAGELSGLVVTEGGAPIEGVEVQIIPGQQLAKTRTDSKGLFVVAGFDGLEDHYIRFRKEGLSPRLFQGRSAGRSGWVIVMGAKTLLEGQIVGPDGQAVSNASVRAGHQRIGRYGLGPPMIWNQTTSSLDGRYKLLVDADNYEVWVQAPNHGTARLENVGVLPQESKQLDIRLESGHTVR